MSAAATVCRVTDSSPASSTVFRFKFRLQGPFWRLPALKKSIFMREMLAKRAEKPGDEESVSLIKFDIAFISEYRNSLARP
jgi:hypothetical protein